MSVILCQYTQYVGPKLGFSFSCLFSLFFSDTHAGVVWIKVQVSCIWSGDATATPLSAASLKSRIVLPFWYQLAQFDLEQRPLNGCSLFFDSIFSLLMNGCFCHVRFSLLNTRLAMKNISEMTNVVSCGT